MLLIFGLIIYLKRNGFIYFLSITNKSLKSSQFTYMPFAYMLLYLCDLFFPFISIFNMIDHHHGLIV